MDKATLLCGLAALAAALPALDAALRLRRLAAPRGDARPPEAGRAPGRLLAVIPSRAEGARVGDLAGDLKRGVVDVMVLLDGPDLEAEARLRADGVKFLSKKSCGPSKGHALAFVAERLAKDLEAYEFILVFDADMRLPEGFFRDLVVPAGTEVFQLPVRPSGVPGPGAPRVEALSLAEALEDDLARDAEGLPVRLRGKAMGFSPRAFRAGPAAATRTTVEDSEATLALLASGFTVRALSGPMAFDEPSGESGAMARSRSRWFAGQLKLLFTGFGDLLQIATRSPKGAFVLAADLWFRPRIVLLGTLAILAIVSDGVILLLSSNGTWTAAARASGRPASGASMLLLFLLLLLSFEAKATLVCEWLSLAALRRRIGYPPEVPHVSLSDVLSSLSMWVGAALRGAAAPSRWHRARPPR
ncbi:MAG: glycosyltransferase family 2 protein [Acidobacteriota bacterium]|nr:glycosyltransferase family 2 protein [Acidobacteriota bacterium]